ncbi:unnamed protein product [Symbiodinium sp. CCMP2592]|nr:unnamed protein product [Symbiodinium sp. CCMP2592]
MRQVSAPLFRDPAWQDNLWDRQLRLDLLEIAQDRLKIARFWRMLLEGAGYGPASNEWRRPVVQLLFARVNTAKRQLQLVLEQQGLAQDQWKEAGVQVDELAAGLVPLLVEVRAMVRPPTIERGLLCSRCCAGLHCNLLVERTSVATVRRSALVQILERFAMPPEKRLAAGQPEEGVNASFLEVWLAESAWEQQLRLALQEKETALQEKAIAVGILQKAAEANDETKIKAAKEEVEAAETKIKAAKEEVEAAEKKVAAGPAQELPGPTVPVDLGDFGLLELGEFKADELLDVKQFMDFVAPNTTADRPLFLRKHLLNVHNKAVEALQAEKIRLVSLVGCPGTGKTWCGWLVAYTLQKVGKKTLHLTIRNSDVTAIANFQVKKQYEEVSWNGHMLKQVLRESKCQVCIVDVSMDLADDATRIFTGVRQLIERNENEFADVKFMGLMSGHGETKIVGKPSLHLSPCKLVLWSWTKDEVEELREKLGDAGAPPAQAYAVCGGSVRFLFKPGDEEGVIRAAVGGLEQADMKRLLALDLGLDDVDKKHRTGLLSFFPRKGSHANDESFAQGVSAARPMPRSDFVIKCIKQNKHAKFEEVLNMYKELSSMNAGAAGCAFELLVHLFWRDAEATEQKVELSLTGKEIAKEVDVDCKQFKKLEEKPKSIEDYNKEAVAVVDDIVGYFTPDSPQYAVLDSILRFKFGGKTEVLAIQISIAKEHKHGPLEDRPQLLPPAPTKPQLALWDFRKGEKPCEWKPKDSHDWELLHVSCQDFDKRMGCS